VIAIDDLRARVALMRELGIAWLIDGPLQLRLGPDPQDAASADIGRVVPDDTAIMYAAAGRVPPDLRRLRGL